MKYYCMNAMQTASYFTSRLGFDYLAFSGLETGSKDTTTHVVKKGECIISFESENKPGTNSDIYSFLMKHGDTIKDIAFEVEDCALIYNNAIKRGAISVSPPQRIEDENGYIIKATIIGFDDVVHTLIERVR